MTIENIKGECLYIYLEEHQVVVFIGVGSNNATDVSYFTTYILLSTSHQPPLTQLLLCF